MTEKGEKCTSSVGVEGKNNYADSNAVQYELEERRTVY